LTQQITSSIFAGHLCGQRHSTRKTTHFVMDTQAVSAFYLVDVHEPSHAHQEKVEVVHRRRLDHPVHSTGEELYSTNRSKWWQSMFCS